MRINAIIERGKDGTYDVYLDFDQRITFGLRGTGATVEDAKKDFYSSRDEMRAFYKEEDKAFPEELEFDFKYDLASFLAAYSDKISLAGLGRLTGVNRKQLGHYLTGERNASQRTVEKIEKALHEFGEEISQVQFT